MAPNSDIAGYASLGADINKRKDEVTADNKEGVVSEKLPELALEMSDDDIVKLTDKWEKVWSESPAKLEWEKKCEENEKYWLGQQHDLPKNDKSRAAVDNLIFESLETYLPQATRRNAEVMVSLDSSEDQSPVSDQYISKLKNRLADIADQNKMRLKLKRAARHWAIYLLGVIKFGWDIDNDIPSARVVRAKKIILDPESFHDEDGYSGNRIGEYRKMEASKLLKIIGEDESTAEAKKTITELVKDDLGTDVQFIEWWTPEYFCWKLNKKIILKKKNPHWNYDRTENPTVDQIASQGVAVDSYGTATAQQVEILGNNHFKVPKMPYEFLTVFNLGDQPMDKTSLIGQNLSNQDLINKRIRQIDKNADNMNGGMVVSLARSGLTQAQAKGVTDAIRKGGAVVIPDGAPREAIDRYPAPAMPADVYNQLADVRSRLRDIFGTRGSTPAGIENEKTVRGKIISRSLDTDRIGGGISEYLEQLADRMYNWFTQLLYVYDSNFQFIGGAVPPKVKISVKEGSLLPRDSTTIANQAIELAMGNKMSTLDLYKRLEYPNPEELAANTWLELNAPEILYQNDPRIAQVVAMKQAAAQAQMEMDAQSKDEETDKEFAMKGVDHSMAIEREQVKQQGKGPAKPRSILSQVPQGALTGGG